MTRFAKSTLLLIVVGALALAGCGGDDNGLSAEDQARITAADDAAKMAQAAIAEAKEAADAAKMAADAAQAEADQATMDAMEAQAEAERARMGATDAVYEDIFASTLEAELKAALEGDPTIADIRVKVVELFNKYGEMYPNTTAGLDAELVAFFGTEAPTPETAVEFLESKRAAGYLPAKREHVLQILDRTAKAASDAATMAQEAADMADTKAGMAQEAADAAQTTADTAQETADTAVTKADTDATTAGLVAKGLTEKIVEALGSMTVTATNTASVIENVIEGNLGTVDRGVRAQAINKAIIAANAVVAGDMPTAKKVGEAIQSVVTEALLMAKVTALPKVTALVGYGGSLSSSDTTAEAKKLAMAIDLSSLIEADVTAAIRAELEKYDFHEAGLRDDAINKATNAAKAVLAAAAPSAKKVEMAIQMALGNVLAGATMLPTMMAATTTTTAITTTTTTTTTTPTGTFASVVEDASANILRTGTSLSDRDPMAYSPDNLTQVGETMPIGGASVANFVVRDGFGGIAEFGGDVRSYGGWLNDNAFGVLFVPTAGDNLGPHAFSLGDDTRANPSMEAEWTGAMVGYRDAGTLGTFTDAGDGFVTGEASIEVSISGGDAMATLSITNVMQDGTNLGALHAAEWIDMPIDGGAFSKAVVDSPVAVNSISGQFYGDGASEVGGVFVQLGEAVPDTGGSVTGLATDTITGAFGASR